MGYNLRRAALVTCALLALLLAASLMPAANLGSFPTAGGGTVSGDAPTGDASTGGAPTPDRVTATPPDSGTDVTTPGTSTTTTTTTTTTTIAAGSESDGGSALAAAAAVLSTVVGWVLVGGVGGLLVALGYAGAVATGAVVFGPEAVAWLPFSAKIRAVPQLTMSTLIGTSSVTASFLGGLTDVLGGVAVGLRSVARVPASLGSVLAEVPLAVAGGFAGGFAAVGSALSNLSLGLGRRSDREREPAATEDAREAEGPDPGQGEAEREPLSVTEAYDLLTDRLPLRNERARTPGEVARTAIDRGWPEAPVRRLVAVFREVRYGGRRETDERTGVARSAIRRLREFWRGSS